MAPDGPAWLGMSCLFAQGHDSRSAGGLGLRDGRDGGRWEQKAKSCPTSLTLYLQHFYYTPSSDLPAALLGLLCLSLLVLVFQVS